VPCPGEHRDRVGEELRRRALKEVAVCVRGEVERELLDAGVVAEQQQRPACRGGFADDVVQDFFSSTVTLALNVADPLIAGRYGKAAFDAARPLAYGCMREPFSILSTALRGPYTARPTRSSWFGSTEATAALSTRTPPTWCACSAGSSG
jgi:hypothetical protein